MPDFEPTRTPDEVTELLRREGLLGKPIGIYRIVAPGNDIPAEAWRGELPPPTSTASRQLADGTTVEACELDLNWSDLVARLTFGAFGPVLDVRLNPPSSPYWTPVIVTRRRHHPARPLARQPVERDPNLVVVLPDREPANIHHGVPSFPAFRRSVFNNREGTPPSFSTPSTTSGYSSARRRASEVPGDRLRGARVRPPRGDRSRCRGGRVRELLARIPALPVLLRPGRRRARYAAPARSTPDSGMDGVERSRTHGEPPCASQNCLVRRDPAKEAPVMTTSKSPSRRLLPRVVTALALVAPWIVFASPATAASGFLLSQMNICNSGYADCYERHDGYADELAENYIRANAPTAVTVNEICEVDVRSIASGTGYQGVFGQAGSQLCRNGSRYGNAIFFRTRAPLSPVWRKVYDAQDGSGAERRAIMCTGPRTFTVCVTHLAGGNRAKTAQAQEMENIVASFARSKPTILGGDWNMQYGGNPNPQDYVPARFWRKSDDDVQHVMAYAGNFGYRSDDPDDVYWTDHPIFSVLTVLTPR